MANKLTYEKLGQRVKRLETIIDISERKQMEEALRESEEKYRTLVENVPVTVYRTTPGPKGKFLMANHAFLKMFRLDSEEELEKMTVADTYINPSERREVSDHLLAKESLTWDERQLKKRDGTFFWGSLNARVAYDEKGKPAYFDCMITDVTERKQAEKTLRARENELEIQTRNLEEMNTALRVLLKRRDEDKIEMEEKVLLNVKEIVNPYLEKLKKCGLNESQKAYAAILESNLNDIISPFSYRLSSRYSNLTPKEIQVADLIKQGRNTKEIGDLMCLSWKTIKTHRRNIRAKLKITNKKANLRTYLLSLK